MNRVAVFLVLVLGVCQYATAQPLVCIDGGVADGDSYGVGCANQGPTFAEVLSAPNLVLICSGSTLTLPAVLDDCTGAGGELTWRAVGSLAAPDLVYDSGDLRAPDFHAWGTFDSSTDPGGGGDGGGEFDVSDLDSAQLAGAWFAGFFIVAMSTVIGFGFRALLDMIRQR